MLTKKKESLAIIVSDINFFFSHRIELAKKLKLDYVYLGYYIKNASRMNYKLKFKEGELFSDGKWRKI